MAYTISPQEALALHYPNLGPQNQSPDLAPTTQQTSLAPSAGGYSYTVAPTAGRGPLGAVPGQIQAPNPAAELQAQVGALPQLNAAASGDIMSQLRGELNPDTQRAIQDAAAAWGAGAGVPGSGITTNRGLRDIGVTAENLQNKGVGNLANFLSSTANTQTVSPELQTNLAIQNAVNAAAPDPTQAASYAQSLFNQYLSVSNPVQTSTTINPLPFQDSYRTSYNPLTGQTSIRTF